MAVRPTVFTVKVNDYNDTIVFTYDAQGFEKVDFHLAGRKIHFHAELTTPRVNAVLGKLEDSVEHEIPFTHDPATIRYQVDYSVNRVTASVLPYAPPTRVPDWPDHLLRKGHPKPNPKGPKVDKP